ncbi:MAG: sigma-70 family RNA polymerase sigma factor [Bacteroidota bacterium]
MSLLKIIQDCIDNKREAQFLLFDTFSDFVIRICERYCPDVPTAKDLSQITFIKIFKNLSAFDVRKGSFKNWIQRIAINECLQFLRKKKLLVFVDDFSTVRLTEELEDDAPSDDHLLAHARIRELIDALPSGYRTVFLLSEVDGYSHKQIGEELGISEATSRSQLFKAKKALKKNWESTSPIRKALQG